MYFGDHPPAHFHAVYGGDEAVIEIETLAVLKGGHLRIGSLRAGDDRCPVPESVAGIGVRALAAELRARAYAGALGFRWATRGATSSISRRKEFRQISGAWA